MKIIEISRHLKRKEFDCGYEELNRYLRQFALPNDKKKIGKTFVAVDEADPSRPVGYYTVSTAQILFGELSDDLKKGLPQYPIPAMRIGKMAVDLSCQGKRICSFLLKDAFLRSLRISSEIALHFILVDAIDEKAKSFYLKYGFIPLKENSLTLVIALKTIEAAFKFRDQ